MIPIQVGFKCFIKGLTDVYGSLYSYSSTYIAGSSIDYPPLLDPVLTESSIQDGIIVDYSLDTNKVLVPINFIISSHNTDSASSLGTFPLTGKLTGKLKNVVYACIIMAYPEDNDESDNPQKMESICTISISHANIEINIQCRFSVAINNQPFIFEQRYLWEHDLLFGSYFVLPQITSIDGELKHAETMFSSTLSFNKQINRYSNEGDKMTFYL